MSAVQTSLQQELVSQMVANRRRFFQLIEALERSASCNLSPEIVEGIIDSEHAGKESVTVEEAQNIMMEGSVTYFLSRPVLRAVV